MRQLKLRSTVVPGGPMGRAYRVVLYHLPANPVTPFVTWLQVEDDSATFHGHYHTDGLEAISEFVDRSRKHGALLEIE